MVLLSTSTVQSLPDPQEGPTGSFPPKPSSNTDTGNLFLQICESVHYVVNKYIGFSFHITSLTAFVQPLFSSPSARSPERPIKVFRNGTLRILQLTELDGGNYLCVFQRHNGEDMELFQV